MLLNYSFMSVTLEILLVDYGSCQSFVESWDLAIKCRVPCTICIVLIRDQFCVLS